MNIKNLFKKEPTKRELCVAMIRDMYDKIPFPPSGQDGLKHLSLKDATDEQVETIYRGLIALKNQYNEHMASHQGALNAAIAAVQKPNNN